MNSSNDVTGLRIDGLEVHEAQSTVIEWLENNKIGNKKVNYKLRDWLFARQRYWGEPFPIVFPEGSNVSIHCLALFNPFTFVGIVSTIVCSVILHTFRHFHLYLSLSWLWWSYSMYSSLSLVNCKHMCYSRILLLSLKISFH